MTELDAVTLLLDGKPHAVPANTSLAELVATLQHPPHKVSTAVNGLFVPRAQRDACILREADAVLLFQPIVGG